MFNYLRQYRFYITLFLFILIPLISIDISTRSSREYRIYDRWIIYLTWPIQTAISWSLDSIVSGFNNYMYLWQTKQDNKELFEENRKLLSTIVKLTEAERENERLKAQFNFRENHELKTILARVVAKDVSTEFRAIRINRGEKDGIRPNMAVVHYEGIIGRVFRTTEHTADVLTVLDLLSAVDSVVERSRVRGIVEGKTDESCQLKFALRTDDIQVGDILLSSGLGGIFPKGIPVGTVSKVYRKSYGIDQNVEIRPSVEFSKIEEVQVIVAKN